MRSPTELIKDVLLDIALSAMYTMDGLMGYRGRLWCNRQEALFDSNGIYIENRKFKTVREFCLWAEDQEVYDDGYVMTPNYDLYYSENELDYHLVIPETKDGITEYRLLNGDLIRAPGCVEGLIS